MTSSRFSRTPFHMGSPVRHRRSGYVSFHHKATYSTVTALIQRRAEGRTEAKRTPPRPSPERSRVSLVEILPRPRASFFSRSISSPLGFGRGTRESVQWPTEVSYQPPRTVLAYKALWCCPTVSRRSRSPPPFRIRKDGSGQIKSVVFFSRM